MDDLINILHGGNHSLVVANGDICTFDQRGIADLYNLLCTDPGFLTGASIADKVVGKGAAALAILGGIRELYADIISEPALELLRENAVRTTYGNKVSHIINRQGTGLCPVEQLCESCMTAAECLPYLKEFMTRT